SSAVGWIPYFCESIAWAGPDRVLYGSDTPFNHMKMEVDKIVVYANAHLQLSVEDLRLVMGGNLKRLLGMASRPAALVRPPWVLHWLVGAEDRVGVVGEARVVDLGDIGLARHESL